MRPSLITYIQKTIKDNQEKFRKEIEMATKTIFEKKVSQVTNELGELLKKKDHREAWTKAGELNSLLKKEEAKDLKPEAMISFRIRSKDTPSRFSLLSNSIFPRSKPITAG